jgi:hypothetical protein
MGRLVTGPIQCAEDLPRHITFSPDGNRIASCSYHTNIACIRDTESGQSVTGPFGPEEVNMYTLCTQAPFLPLLSRQMVSMLSQVQRRNLESGMQKQARLL